MVASKKASWDRRFLTLSPSYSSSASCKPAGTLTSLSKNALISSSLAKYSNSKRVSKKTPLIDLCPKLGPDWNLSVGIGNFLVTSISCTSHRFVSAM